MHNMRHENVMTITVDLSEGLSKKKQRCTLIFCIKFQGLCDENRELLEGEQGMSKILTILIKLGRRKKRRELQKEKPRRQRFSKRY